MIIVFYFEGGKFFGYRQCRHVVNMTTPHLPQPDQHQNEEGEEQYERDQGIYSDPDDRVHVVLDEFQH